MRAKCSVSDCEGVQHAGGYCKKHYARWRRNGDPLLGRQSVSRNGKCLVEDCEKPRKGRGWCAMHYWRWQHHSDPLVGGREEYESILEKILSNIEIDERSGCWIWTGSLGERDYGVTSHAGVRYSVHCVTCEHYVGPIPDGYEVDHLCRVHNCCNPDHLEAVTHQENVRRGKAGKLYVRPTHCSAGHEFTEENTYWCKEVKKTGIRRRVCATCAKKRSLDAYYRRKQMEVAA